MSINRLAPLCYVIPLLASCAGLSVQVKTEVESGYLPADQSISSKVLHNRKDMLKVLTLNVAHERKDGTNQILLKKETIETNLTEVSDMLIEADADIVALQEADGPSG